MKKKLLTITIYLLTTKFALSATTNLSFSGTVDVTDDIGEHNPVDVFTGAALSGTVSYDPNALPQFSGPSTIFESELDLVIELKVGNSQWKLVGDGSLDQITKVYDSNFDRLQINSFGKSAIVFPSFLDEYNFTMRISEEGLGDLFNTSTLPQFTSDIFLSDAQFLDGSIQTSDLESGERYGFGFSIDRNTVTISTVPEASHYALIASVLSMIVIINRMRTSRSRQPE